MFHGGAQTSHFYEHAPDGGPGFAQLLAAVGRTGRLDSLMTTGNIRPLRTTDPSGRVGHTGSSPIHLVDRAQPIGGSTRSR